MCVSWHTCGKLCQHTQARRYMERSLDPLDGEQEQLTNTRTKLEESKAQLSSSEQMVRWLNTQVCTKPHAPPTSAWQPLGTMCSWRTASKA